MEIKIPYGKDQIKFNIPNNWRLIDIQEPKQKKPIPKNQISSIVKNSLLNPINHKSLKDSIKKDDKVVIVVDDITRPTPTQLIVEPLIDFLLKDIGLKKDNIKIIFALGVHRNMTQDEAVIKLGLNIAKKISWENHYCKHNLTDLGTSFLKTPIKINKNFIDADFKIVIGLIEPHPWAGFSGGYKAVMPGLSGLNTIIKNHELILKSNVKVGNIQNNPFRNDIDEIGKKTNLNFIINCILDSNKELCKIVAGDPKDAFLEGVKVARQNFEIKTSEIADVIIASSSPIDINFGQSCKAAFNTMDILKKNGVMIIVSPCFEGIGKNTITKRILGRKVIKFFTLILPSKILMKIIRLQSDIIELSAGAFQILKFVSKNQLIFLSDGLTEEEKKTLFIVDHVKHPEEAISSAQKILDKNGKKPIKVAIFPQGGCTYPSIKK